MFFAEFYPKIRNYFDFGFDSDNRQFFNHFFQNFVVKIFNLTKCGNVYKLIYSKMDLSGGGCSFWRIKYFGKIFKIRQIEIISVL